MLLENDVKGRWHYTFWNTTLAVLTFALIQSYTTICRSFYSLSGADYQFCNVFNDLDITMKNHERHRHVTMVDCYITGMSQWLSVMRSLLNVGQWYYFYLAVGPVQKVERGANGCVASYGGKSQDCQRCISQRGM